MHVQRLRLKTGETVGDGYQPLAPGRQILQTLVEAEVLHAVDADLHPQEGAELLLHTAHQVLAVDA